MSHVSSPSDYYQLNPDTVIQAIEHLGLISDACIYPLNSYENRVYQVGIEGENPIIAKFYRPKRWSDEAILEEQQFSIELHNADLSVIAPQVIADNTLHYYEGYRFSIYPRFGGHAPELTNESHLEQLGRLLGRLHNVGEVSCFEHRPTLSYESHVQVPMQWLRESAEVSAHVKTALHSVLDELDVYLKQAFAEADFQTIRLHGDCHTGNILWRDEHMHLLDFDDSLNGPAIWDIWMLLSASETERRSQLSHFLRGYESFREFDDAELRLIEPFRTTRMLFYAYWLGRRWSDPAFPHNFPWFNTDNYWETFVLEMKEQLALLQAKDPQLNTQQPMYLDEEDEFKFWDEE